MQGPRLEQKLRELYGEIDVGNSAGSEGIDVDELRVGLQVIRMCDVIRAHVWRDSLMCATWYW